MAIKSREPYMIMRKPETHMEVKIDLTKENAGDLAIQAHNKGYAVVGGELTMEQYRQQFQELSAVVNPKSERDEKDGESEGQGTGRSDHKTE